MTPAGTGGRDTSKLYTAHLLSLATQLADYPLTDDLSQRAEARSRTCGSTIIIGVGVDGDATVERLGMQVSACAIGQASAATLASTAHGRTAGEFSEASKQIEVWLAGEGDSPQWPGFEALAPALPHRGRHAALMLPWKAMVEALSSPASNS